MRLDTEQTPFDSFQLGEDIHHLIIAPQETANSFTALLELPPNQAVELLRPDTGPCPGPQFAANLTFPTNTGLIERAAMFSIFPGAGSISSPETSLNIVKIVKSEPGESDSNLYLSKLLISVPAADNGGQSQSSLKRKERERKVKGSSKKIKSASSQDSQTLPYVHLRARPGQATDSHSLAERARREKINARMKLLQELVPGCNQISGTASVLDEIISHVQCLQRQVELLSMRLATVNPRIDVNLDGVLSTKSGSIPDSDFPNMVIPLMWPEVQVNGNRQSYQQHCQSNLLHFHQPFWEREEGNHNLITPENLFLSYNSSATTGC